MSTTTIAGPWHMLAMNAEALTATPEGVAAFRAMVDALIRIPLKPQTVFVEQKARAQCMATMGRI